MEWLNDEKATEEFLQQHKLTKLLEEKDLDTSGLEGKNFTRVENFLPEKVADAVLAAVKRLQDWEVADGEDDGDYDDAIAHRFSLSDLVNDDDEEEGATTSQNQEDRNLLRKFGSLLWRLHDPEGTLPNFTAACYKNDDFIEPHDDFVLEEYAAEEVAEAKAQFGWQGEPRPGKPRTL